MLIIVCHGVPVELSHLVMPRMWSGHPVNACCLHSLQLLLLTPPQMDGFCLLDGHQADDEDVGGGDDVVALPPWMSLSLFIL